jgi:hypothetical protein
LQLADPVLENVFQSSRVTLPPAPSTDPVRDFQFAPGGRFLAYRLGDNASSRLIVARAPTWQAQTLEFAGPVVSYAWSPDGAALAVAFQSGADKVLGGLDLSQVDAATENDPGPEIPGARRLTPTPAAVVSELFWFADESLAFGAWDPDYEDNYLFHARLEGTSFTAPAWGEIFYDERYRLIGGDRGVFAADPSALRSFFVPVQDGNAVVPHQEVVVSPRGEHTGRVVGGELQLFLPRERARRDDSPTLPRVPCKALLSWAEGRERIACAIERDGENAPFVYDLENDPIVSLAPLRGQFSYPLGSEIERRRQFSPSGRWFAFTTDTHTHFVDLTDATPFVRSVSQVTSPPTAPNSYLVFSPNEELLLEQRGPRLSVHHLFGAYPELVSTQLEPAATCTEEFWRGPGSWCGGRELDARLVWSPDSTLLAYRTALGVLELYWMSTSEVVSVDTCFPDCAHARSFAFQPARDADAP